jgi:hypothetical protein
VKLGWILLDETNSEWKAKSKVVLDYKLKHTNKELDGRLTCRRGALRALNRGEVGRPEPTGLGASTLLLARFFSSTLILALLLCDCVLHGVAHRPNALVHSFACIIGHSI